VYIPHGPAHSVNKRWPSLVMDPTVREVKEEKKNRESKEIFLKNLER
jgi:hypothetical protein